MGIYNASAALRVEPDKLGPAPRMTLLAMALMTMDADTERQDARLYFGGWQMVCMRMGFLPSDDMRRRFIRDIATLRQLGIVEVVESAHRGRTAVYRLHLPVDNFDDSVDIR